jgi:hypothetical protein
MKITRRQLRIIIRESLLQEGTLFMTHGDYGYIGLEDDAGNEYTMGEIVADLLDAGATDEIFMVKGDHMADSLARIQKARADKVQGGIERWDSDVFDGYYDIDRDRAVEVWAVLNGHKVEVVEEEVWDEYPEQVQASREAAWEEENY